MRKSVLSLNSKLFLFFLAIGLFAIIILSLYSYITTRNALLERTYSQLTSVRVIKKKQLEKFFEARLNETLYLSRKAELEHTFFLFDNKKQQKKCFKDINSFIASSAYISHIIISNFEDYYTIDSQKIVLSESYHKEPDTNKRQQLLKQIGLKARALAGVFIHDYFFKDEVSGNYNMYIGAPLHQNDSIKGFMAVGISAEGINEIMLETDSRSGLGETGESYLVGHDYIMRSSSRFEDDAFLSVLAKTDAVTQAFSGDEGTAIIKDYRGIDVLSSYSLFQKNDLEWAILAEIDLKEAMIPIAAYKKRILFISILVALLLLPLSYFLAGKITRPLVKLNKAVKFISRGQYDTYVHNTSKDEIGALTRSVNIMADKIKKQTKDIIEREERLQHFYNATKDGIILHKDGQTVLVNQALCDMTVYTEKELSRMHLDSFLILKLTEKTKSQSSPFLSYETLLVKKDQTVLEVEVQEADIEYKNEKIRAVVIRDISKRKTAEKALAAERSKRLSTLIDGQEMERQRLSRELHDGLGQYLVAIKLKLENTVDTDFEKTKEAVNDMKKMFDNTIEEVRRISNDLMPAVLYEFGLYTGLSNLCKRIDEIAPFTVSFYSNLTTDNNNNKVKTYLYRIAQEALSNCLKHAEPETVKVFLIQSTNTTELIIKDDGKGFNFEKHLKKSGNGILNMRERAHLLNSKLIIRSKINKGTLISIKIA